MDKPVAVSMRGDKVMLQSLKALAQSKGKVVADLTREAINTVYGDELAPYISFFTKSVYQVRQESNSDPKPFDDIIDEPTPPISAREQEYQDYLVKSRAEFSAFQKTSCGQIVTATVDLMNKGYALDKVSSLSPAEACQTADEIAAALVGIKQIFFGMIFSKTQDSNEAIKICPEDSSQANVSDTSAVTSDARLMAPMPDRSKAGA